eukprot:g19745.t1
MISDKFDWRRGSECYAGLFIKPKAEPSTSLWLPIQLKTTSCRNKAWARKMRSVLHNKKNVLHGAVLLGYCPADLPEDEADLFAWNDPKKQDPSDGGAKCVLVELVHRCKDYSSFNPIAPEHNVALRDLPKVLEAFWVTALGVRVAPVGEMPGTAEALLAYSPQTLSEKRARAFFAGALTTDPHPHGQLRYNLSADEFSCIDGHLVCAAPPPSVPTAEDVPAGSKHQKTPGRKLKAAAARKSGAEDLKTAPMRRFSFRVQEKLLSVRKERGKEWGLRCSMRR